MLSAEEKNQKNQIKNEDIRTSNNLELLEKVSSILSNQKKIEFRSCQIFGINMFGEFFCRNTQYRVFLIKGGAEVKHRRCLHRHRRRFNRMHPLITVYVMAEKLCTHTKTLHFSN